MGKMSDITPKEAIANLNHLYGMVAPDIQRSLDVAIKALERPTGDLISRSALKETLKENEWITDDPFADGGGLEEIIDNAQTVEEDKIIQNHSIESKAYVEWFKKGYKEGERTSLDLAKRVVAKFEGYLDDDMIARIQIALEKESEATNDI